MDGLLHATRKILIERARATTQQDPDSIPDTAPPAYSAIAPSTHPVAADPYDSEDDDDDDEDDDSTEDPSPVTVTLDATTSVQGQNNLVATGAALADATRFSALLLAAVQSLNARAEEEARLAALAPPASSAAGAGATPRAIRPILRVNLVLNCGINVVGDKNVVGYRPAAKAGQGQEQQVMQPLQGVKRKADEVWLFFLSSLPSRPCTDYIARILNKSPWLPRGVENAMEMQWTSVAKLLPRSRTRYTLQSCVFGLPHDRGFLHDGACLEQISCEKRVLIARSHSLLSLDRE